MGAAAFMATPLLENPDFPGRDNDLCPSGMAAGTGGDCDFPIKTLEWGLGVALGCEHPGGSKDPQFCPTSQRKTQFCIFSPEIDFKNNFSNLIFSGLCCLKVLANPRPDFP